VPKGGAIQLACQAQPGAQGEIWRTPEMTPMIRKGWS
jgi:hypothetical protein